MKKIFIIIFLAGLILCSSDIKHRSKLTAHISPRVESASISVPEPSTQNVSPQTLETQMPESKPAETFPDTVNLDVPFVSQAPFASWDNLHNEACEEASILSVVSYLENQILSKSEIDEKIYQMVDWQMANFGGHFDLTANKTKVLVKEFYNNKYSVTINYDFSMDDIKRELAHNNPVIVPLSGRTIGNPYFRQPGPVYHMLVIRGYDDNSGEFITNDVGTNKEGENFRYPYDTFFDSIHDMPKWEQNKDLLDADPNMIFEGQKAMIIINR